MMATGNNRTRALSTIALLCLTVCALAAPDRAAAQDAAGADPEVPVEGAGSDGGVTDEPEEVVVSLPAVDEYARVAASGASLRNLPDPDGVAVMEVATGTPVAVHRRQAGWALVEPPGGVEAWVFGRYLRASTPEGCYELTGNGINLRPLPRGDVSSYPLPVRLQAGDRVLLLERKDPALELAADWARVRAPMGVTAWIATDEIEALPADGGLPQLWKLALDRLGASGALSVEEAQATPSSPELASEALSRAEALRESMLQSDEPDFDAIRAAFDAVIELAPASDASVHARAALALLKTEEQASEVEALLEQELLERQREFERRQADIREASQRADPLGALFDRRGRIERRGGPDAEPRYFLLWGGGVSCELSCQSGRYDLELFAGYSVGLNGLVVASEEPATEGGEARPTLLDVARLSVLRRR